MQQLASHGQKSLLGLEEAANHRSALPQRLVKGQPKTVFFDPVAGEPTPATLRNPQICQVTLVERNKKRLLKERTKSIAIIASSTTKISMLRMATPRKRCCSPAGHGNDVFCYKRHPFIVVCPKMGYINHFILQYGSYPVSIEIAMWAVGDIPYCIPGFKTMRHKDLGPSRLQQVSYSLACCPCFIFHHLEKTLTTGFKTIDAHQQRYSKHHDPLPHSFALYHIRWKGPQEVGVDLLVGERRTLASAQWRRRTF